MLQQDRPYKPGTVTCDPKFHADYESLSHFVADKGCAWLSAFLVSHVSNVSWHTLLMGGVAQSLKTIGQQQHASSDRSVIAGGSACMSATHVACAGCIYIAQ